MTIKLDFESNEQLKHLKSLIDILYDTDFYQNSAPEMKRVLDVLNKEVDREIETFNDVGRLLPQNRDDSKPDLTLKHRHKDKK